LELTEIEQELLYKVLIEE